MFQIAHFMGAEDREAIALIGEDCEETPEDFCPVGMTLKSVTEIEADLPHMLPMDETWMKYEGQ